MPFHSASMLVASRSIGVDFAVSEGNGEVEDPTRLEQSLPF